MVLGSPELEIELKSDRIELDVNPGTVVRIGPEDEVCCPKPEVEICCIEVEEETGCIKSEDETCCAELVEAIAILFRELKGETCIWLVEATGILFSEVE